MLPTPTPDDIEDIKQLSEEIATYIFEKFEDQENTICLHVMVNVMYCFLSELTEEQNVEKMIKIFGTVLLVTHDLAKRGQKST